MSHTVHYQLETAIHALGHSTVSRNRIAITKKFEICRSAHEFPSAFYSSFGLIPSPFQLYNIIAFEKVHLLDLGIIRQFVVLPHVISGRDPLFHSLN